jgi:large subunit ribosomal protein L18
VNRLKTKKMGARRRRLHVRRTVVGTAQRPRLTVSKSLRFTTAQLIDDHAGSTLVFWSTGSSAARSDMSGKNKTEAAREAGKKIAAMASEKGITEVVFDRNVYVYHGRIKAVADGAREGGLKF